MDSGLKTMSASFLKTLGCMSSGPIDFISGPGFAPHLEWEGFIQPPPTQRTGDLERSRKPKCQWSLRQRTHWVSQTSLLQTPPVHASCLSGGIQSLHLFFIHLYPYRILLVILQVICQAMFQLSFLFPHPIPTHGPYICTLPRLPVPASTSSAFASCSSAGGADPCLVKPVSSLSCSTSYTQG